MNQQMQMQLRQMFGNNPNFNRAMQMVQGKTEQQIQQTVMNLMQSQGMNMDSLRQIASQYGFKL